MTTNNYKTFNELTDSQRQTVATKLINSMSHVLLQNTVVEYILSKQHEDYENVPFSGDDIENNHTTGQIEINGYYETLTEEERDEKVEFYNHLLERAEHVAEQRGELLENASDEDYNILDNKHNKALDKVGDIESIISDLEDMYFDEYPEIMQWFECDDYMIDRLREKGEIVLDDTYWGRTCCGQSIVLDGVIQTIAYEYFLGNHCLPDDLQFMLVDTDSTKVV